MALRVRFQGGPDAGRVVEFDDGVEIVRFGRDARLCQVAFPESERRVSREHFAIRRVLGRYRLVTNRESPVFVDGEPGHDDQVLGSMSEIRAGVDGPRVVVEIVSESPQASTVGRIPPVAGLHTNFERLGSRVGRNRLVTLLAVALAASVGVAGFLAYRLVNRKVDEGARALARTAEAMEKVRLDTLKKIDDSQALFRGVFTRVEPSVYLVLLRLEEAGHALFVPTGTAWSIGDGRLATNAHVARGADDQGPGASLVVRSTASPPVDLEIATVTVHPGFEDFEQVLGLDAMRAFDPNVGTPLALVPACDVAVMEVAETDREKLAPPLEIAPPDIVAALGAGEPVAFMGFPAEGIVHGGVDVRRPRATSQIGIVTSMTDFFFGRAARESAQLVHMSMAVAGGASGSPIVDRQGRVVAILSAGNFVGVPGAGARVPVGGINYAQRVDLLGELLGTTDESKTDPVARRAEQWRQLAAENFRAGAESLLFILGRQIASQWSLAGTPVELRPIRDERKPLGALDEPAKVSVEAPREGHFAAIVVAENPVPIGAGLYANGAMISLAGEGTYYAALVGRASEKQRVEVHVAPSGQPAPPGTTVRIRIFEVVETGP